MLPGEHYIAAIERRRLQLYLETRVPGELSARLVRVSPDEPPTPGARLTSGVARTPPPPRARRERAEPGGAMADESPRPSRGDLAATLDAFLRRHPSASWDFAGSPVAYAQLIEVLSASSLRRLKRVLTRLPTEGLEEIARPEFAHASDR